MKSIGETIFIGLVTLLLLTGSVYLKIKRGNVVPQRLANTFTLEGRTYVMGIATGNLPLVRISDWSINDSLSKNVFYDHAVILSNDTIYSLTSDVDSGAVEYDFVLTQILNQSYSFK